MMNKKEKKALIEKLSASLNEVSVKQTEWAIAKHKAFIEKNKEQFTKSGRRCFKHEMLFSILQYSGDWQIHRVFNSVVCITNRQTRFDVDEFEEVSQFYLNVHTQEQGLMQRPLKFMGKGWNTFKPMAYRDFDTMTYNSAYYAEIYGEKIINSTLHPIVCRNGLTMEKLEYFDRNNCDFREIIKRVTSDSFFETLIKSDQWKLAQFAFKNDVEKKAMLLNLRFGIDISHFKKDQFSLWCDALSLMDEVSIDWHNPKILADWRHQHDVAVKRKSKLDEQKELEKMAAYEGEFFEAHKQYLGIEFENDGLHFRTLNSVRDYYEEGKHMHHCVYQCRYFLKKDVLIFSIRDDNGDRLATLEYNVKSKKIEQCRAVCNNVPERYDDMVATFNANTWRLTPSKQKVSTQKQKGNTQKQSVKSPKKKQPLLNVA